MGNPFKKITKDIMKPINKMKETIMKPVKQILDPVKKGVLFVKCWIRIITNFPKCITFYALDYVKFVFLFVPLMVFSLVTGQGKKGLQRNYAMIDDLIKWGPGIQYDCYVCKKIKKKKGPSFWETLSQAILGGGSKGMSFVFWFVMTLLFFIIYLVSLQYRSTPPLLLLKEEKNN